MAKKRHYHEPRKKKGKKALIAWICAASGLLVVGAFFITSLCLANAHGLTLVQEWRNWFGIAEQGKVILANANPIIHTLF